MPQIKNCRYQAFLFRKWARIPAPGLGVFLFNPSSYHKCPVICSLMAQTDPWHKPQGHVLLRAQAVPGWSSRRWSSRCLGSRWAHDSLLQQPYLTTLLNPGFLSDTLAWDPARPQCFSYWPWFSFHLVQSDTRVLTGPSPMSWLQLPTQSGSKFCSTNSLKNKSMELPNPRENLPIIPKCSKKTVAMMFPAVPTPHYLPPPGV